MARGRSGLYFEVSKKYLHNVFTTVSGSLVTKIGVKSCINIVISASELDLISFLSTSTSKIPCRPAMDKENLLSVRKKIKWSYVSLKAYLAFKAFLYLTFINRTPLDFHVVK